MNVYSLAFYRHDASEYERADVGASRGAFFKGYVRAVVRAFWSVWPDWSLWIHHDERVTEFEEFALLRRYEMAGLVRLVPCGEAKTLTGAMLWRLKPCFDPGVERVLCRDIDSLPQPRERVAVERWMASGKPVSALHDSVSHAGTVLLGGMCGFDARWIRERWTWDLIQASMNASGIDFNRKGGDQHFLNGIFSSTADILSENVESVTWDRDRNFCEGYARCLGGGFNAEGVRKWYDRQQFTDARILACEG